MKLCSKPTPAWCIDVMAWGLGLSYGYGHAECVRELLEKGAAKAGATGLLLVLE